MIYPFLLLHGWGLNPTVWQPWSARLAAPVLAPALPGHGGGPWSGQQTLAAWAEHVLRQAPPRALWLGWSLGGLITLQAALMAPARLAAAIVLATTPRFIQAADWPAALPAAILTEFQHALQNDPVTTLQRFLALQSQGTTSVHTTVRRLRAVFSAAPPPDPAALAVGLELLRTSDLRPALAASTVPTLWLFGACDPLVPAAVASAVAQWMPASRQEVVAGAGHALWWTQPEATAAAITAFVHELQR